MSKKNKKNQLKLSSYNNLFNKINNLIKNCDSLYLEMIKKEFYTVNRDVVLSKIKYEIPVDLSNITNTKIYNNSSLFDNMILNYKANNIVYHNKNNELDINI
jgi:hypothetical protein